MPDRYPFSSCSPFDIRRSALGNQDTKRYGKTLPEKAHSRLINMHQKRMERIA
jgi:hypothetical protein